MTYSIFIALIVGPNSPCDESGTVNLLLVKAAKVSKICDDIESLIPNWKSAVSQVLLPLNIYKKTPPSEVITGFHRLVHTRKLNSTKINGSNSAKNHQNWCWTTLENVFLLHISCYIVIDNIDWKIEKLTTQTPFLIQKEYATKQREIKPILL